MCTAKGEHPATTEAGVDAEIVDPRTLLLPFHMDAIKPSVCK
jgi:hypothetical protein